ncbi:Mariner Mos1 transposase [Eumeta japonica]|uniref:Mariner Mos1 transposase n=1 Tax=Eumeta variegata TaxID=151549 RepID=A0A4C2A900_EUMVA|nr:Mariner Mos1 transposase [Eumeta japonica]
MRFYRWAKPDLYCQKLMRLKEEVEKKRLESKDRKGVIFHHDNARPHTLLDTQQILREFGWEVLTQALHSSDLAPSEFHLFRPVLCHNTDILSLLATNGPSYNSSIISPPQNQRRRLENRLQPSPRSFAADSGIITGYGAALFAQPALGEQ